MHILLIRLVLLTMLNTALLLSVSGCGKKGPLYLDKTESGTASEQQK